MPRKIHKKDGTLTKHYSDMPRFQAIFGYEGQFKKTASKMVKQMTKEITSNMDNFVHKNNSKSK